MWKRLRCDRRGGERRREEREKEGERSGDRRQGWVWAERKRSGVQADLGQTAFTETSHIVCQDFSGGGVPNLEIAPLGGEHSGGHFGILYSD